MGVRFYDSEDMFSDDDYSTSCCSCTCQSSCQNNTSTTATTTNATKASTNNNLYNGNNMDKENLTYPIPGGYKDIVGNCKEVRVEENYCNLRIIGNNNRIRITLNMGDLIVIGNNTRLKVKTNHGHIKYTGNDGRISIGNDSKQQLVDYIGCNGILKVVNSMKFHKQKCTEVNNASGKSDNINNNKNSTTLSGKKIINKQFIGNNTKTTTTKNLNNKTKEKSHSFDGSTSFTRDHNKWQQFNNIFNNNFKKSMPNLTTSNYCNPALPANIIQNIGNIVIADSSNICITPYSRNITTAA